MIKTYVKRPVEVQAVQWTGDNFEEIWEFMKDSDRLSYVYDDAKNILCIQTLEGDHYAPVGDYIIRGVKGEFYPCKPDIFEKTYDELCEQDCD